MLLGARQFFERRGAPTPPGPYDARVLYVETDGVGSYINTGIVPDLTTVITMDFAVRKLSYLGSGTTYNCVCGAVSPNLNIILCRFGLNVSFNNNQFRFITPSLSDSTLNSPTYDNNIHNASIAFHSSGGVSFDGVSLPTSTTSSSDYMDVLCLGAGRDVSRSTIANRDRLFTGTRFYSCKIYTNNILVFDGIPVVANGVAGIYDSISGTVKTNAAATGTITAGPRV